MTIFIRKCVYEWPISMAERSTAWVCVPSPAEIVGSNLAGDTNVCLVWVFVCRQVEVFATSWPLVKEESCRLRCVVVCDLETSKMRRPWPTLGRGVTGKNIYMVMNAKQKSSYFHSNMWCYTFSLTSLTCHVTEVCHLIWRILHTIGNWLHINHQLDALIIIYS